MSNNSIKLDDLEAHLQAVCHESNKDIVKAFVASSELNQLANEQYERDDDSLHWDTKNILKEGITVYPRELNVLELFVAGIVPSLLFPSPQSLFSALCVLAVTFLKLRREGKRINCNQAVVYYAVKKTERKGISLNILVEQVKSEYIEKTGKKKPFVEGDVEAVVNELIVMGVLSLIPTSNISDRGKKNRSCFNCLN